jgi:glycosyltransferase involved in cell wall biosynthesis
MFALSQALLRSGHDVTVVGTILADDSRIDDLYRMERYPRLLPLARGGRSEDAYGRVAALRLFLARTAIDRLRPDLIIINGALPFAFDAPSCTVAHDAERRIGHLGFLQSIYKRFSYTRSKYLVATCTEVRDAVSKELALDRSLFTVIPTCIDTAVYRPMPLEQRDDAILHVGTAVYKNPLATVRAFQACERGGAHLYITGNPSRDVRDRIARLDPKTRQRIELLGIISADSLRNLLSRVKIVSVPSRYYAPVASPTVMEAFASATPVVALDGISGDLLESGVSGFRCTGETEMALRYQQLLADNDLWSRMSRAGLAAAQRFSASRVAEAYLRLA